MQICNHIFCQKLHIAYSFAYNGIFKIAYVEIILYMQKFAYIHIYAAYFRICDRIFQHFPCPTFIYYSQIILAADDYQYLQLDFEKIEVENVKTVQNRPINVNVDHDQHSPSLELAYAGNMRHICCICVLCALYVLTNSAYISAYLSSKSSVIFRTFSTINPDIPYVQTPNYVYISETPPFKMLP